MNNVSFSVPSILEGLALAPTSSSTDDESNSYNNIVPTAKYVQGGVGMVKGRFKKIRGMKLLYRRGVLVINLSDGGTITFYKNKSTTVGREDSVENMEGEGERGKRSIISGVTVSASMEEQKLDLADEPYLDIPESVPWKFLVTGSNSFKIVVPSVHGKLDQRVVLTKNVLGKLLDRANTKDDTDDSYYQDDIDPYNSPNSQVFEFKCLQSGELAFYARAAATLGRNFTIGSGGYGGSMMPGQAKINNVRTRTAAGVEIAEQTARIGRTKSVAHARYLRTGSQGEGEKEFRCFPLYCYPKTWFTKADLAIELPRSSKNIHDLRRGTPDEIGWLNVEVLQCSGLPNMDRYGLTDAVCYIVCGSSAFVTDVIPDNCNPCWLPLSRRACILPIHNAYQQVYVGVFDYDGEKSEDDFIGRVVIDVAQLRAEAGIIDVTLPLREFSRVYNRKQLGSIRLRIQLNWATPHGERAALLAYLPRNFSDVTKRFQSPVSNPVTVVCPDVKSFQNIVATVYGKDFPGKYKSYAKTALTREVKLINTTLVYNAKKIILSTLKWKRPLLSAYVFSSWMYFVILCDIDKIPVWMLSFLFIGMLDNYVKYHVNSTSAQLFGHRTIEEMLSLLLFKHEGSKNKKEQVVSQKNSASTLDKVLIWIFGMPTTTLESWKVEDHAEYPFSNGKKEPKRSSNDVAARQIWEAADEVPDIFSDVSKQEIDDDNEHYEYSCDDSDNEESLDGNQKIDLKKLVKKGKQLQGHISGPSLRTVDQNVSNSASGGTTIKEQLDKWHAKAQKYTFHLFDDRAFITEERGEAKKALHMNATKNPVAKKLNPLLATVMKIFECEVSAFRAVFNIFLWKDPMLSFCFLMLIFCLMLILLVFPWRIFFFFVGLLGFGPQNYFSQTCLLDVYIRRKQRKTLETMNAKGSIMVNQSTGGVQGRNKIFSSVAPLLQKTSTTLPHRNALSIRNNTQMKSDGRLREVIVPSVPFRYTRFYDWPPDPQSVSLQEA